MAELRTVVLMTEFGKNLKYFFTDNHGERYRTSRETDRAKSKGLYLQRPGGLSASSTSRLFSGFCLVIGANQPGSTVQAMYDCCI